MSLSLKENKKIINFNFNNFSYCKYTLDNINNM